MSTVEKAKPKRDALVANELKIQKQWEETKVFESNPNPGQPKYMVTFPYPYMNGKLHLGHAFSLSKPEFAVGYERLKGKNTLFPFGFHVTGMPIKACADKLKVEVEKFGKYFENFVEPESEPEAVDQKAEKSADPSKQKKHGKQAAKSTGLQYQFQIMRSINVPNEDIHKFADPMTWLSYFPPLCQKDLKRLGLHVDWRRSFITTDVNPYYDSFIRWQFNQLRELNKVQFGERYTIFSALDGQACLDHDRASGEGVGVQEYTGIKLQVLLDELNKIPLDSRFRTKSGYVGEKFDGEFLKKLNGRKLFYVAATLRPETMYGQTNCYVGSDLQYGIFVVNDREAWICTERAAKNMAYQGLFETKGSFVKLMDIKGTDLVGLPLSAPLSAYPIVYTLPMENVLATKGTGIVTSVPSDSPDDYITLMDLLKKFEYYNVNKDWVEPFLPPKPIIQTPNLGSLAAVSAVEKLKINSQKDKKQLAEAKEMTYKEGFYNGTIIVGEYSGKSVQEAKPLIKKMLIDQGLAFTYCEPEGQVISRSGDECIVALVNQWYLDYGEAEWRKKTESLLERMNTYSDETRHAFAKTLEWLGQWACSRSFGLGSRLPWDPEWLIESLSDSTIYMAYYTVAHLLHGGSIDGSKVGPAGIKANQMTDEVWSYILLGKEKPETDIPEESLKALRAEFEYYYPLDLRVSGKDLISNHLTFFMYNHTAIFPPEKWPKAVRTNGHLLLNSEKMSKSTGNFMTIEQALEKYGADALRFALADAGDGLEDANFLEKTADDAILKLFTEKEWMEQVECKRNGDLSWNDNVFINEMNHLVIQAEKAYDSMLFREALKVSFYELQNARNDYRKAVTGHGLQVTSGETFEGMHEKVIAKYMEISALLMAPITTHWSESIWMDVLKKPTSILEARWPVTDAAQVSFLKAAQYVRGLPSKIRAAEEKLASKKKTKTVDDSPKKLKLFIASSFPDWQEKAVEVLKSCYDEKTKTFVGEKEKLQQMQLLKDKRVMPFVSFVKKEVEQIGVGALDRALLFSEKATLEENLDYLCRDLFNLHVKEIELVDVESCTEEQDAKKAELSVPGQPTYRIVQL